MKTIEAKESISYMKLYSNHIIICTYGYFQILRVQDMKILYVHKYKNKTTTIFFIKETLRKNEIMIRSNKGLYFSFIYFDNKNLKITLDQEPYFKNEWVRAAAEVDYNKWVVSLMGDNNVYVVDRTLGLVMRQISGII